MSKWLQALAGLTALCLGGARLYADDSAHPGPHAEVSSVPAYGIFEQSFTFASSAYSNPWEQVSGSMTVTSPSGVQKTVGLFYYGPNTWKARFAPSQTGNWAWQASITDGSQAQQFKGAFTVTASTWPGFVRQNTANPFRWITENGASFHPVGIGDCVTTNLNGMSVDSSKEMSAADYFGAFQEAGVNVFRWSVDNCSYKLWSRISETGNSYLTAEGQAGDTLVQTLRQYGMRTYMAALGNGVPYPNQATPAQLSAVKRYVKYIVDRYGAYVDFWELMNEATVDSNWYEQIAQYLRSVDPYSHPISTSWEQPKHARIDIVSPHWYQTEPDSEADLYPAWKFRDWKASGVNKPVIVGEQGNGANSSGVATCNWDATSAVRMRIRAWSSFFNEGSLIFWHTGFSKSYCRNPSNIYLGPEERGYLKNLQAFTNGFDTQAAMTGVMNGSSGTLPVSDSTRVRAYGLRSATMFAAYVHAFSNHTSATSGIKVTVNPAAAGVATWYAPSTGQLLGTQNVVAGTQDLTVPAFTTDAALKITASSKVPASPLTVRASASGSGNGTYKPRTRPLQVAGHAVNVTQPDRDGDLPPAVLPPAGSDLIQSSPATAAPGDAFTPRFSDASVASGAPVIAAWNDTAMPNESFTLTGSALSAKTGADEGSDTVVWISAYTPSGTVLRQAKIWKASATLVTGTIPADLPYGMYMVWVENSNGASTPVAINQAQAAWLGPLGNIAAPGATKRVFGKNLSNGHGTSLAYVYLQPQSGGALVAATVSSVEPYAVGFTVPSNLAAGNYNVYVHNGHGGAYGWSKGLPLTVAAAWVRDSNQIAVSPSGGDDSGAIQAALNTQAAKANGGIVSLAAGTYVIHSMLSVGAKAKLAGAGKDATTIEIRLSAGAPSGLQINGDKVELQGFTLKLFSSAGMPSYGIMNSTGAPAARADVKIHDVRWTADPAAYNSSNDMNIRLLRGEISDSESFREFRVLDSSDTWIHDSAFHGGPFIAANAGAEGAISIENMARTVIETNSFSTPAYTRSPVPSTVSARRVLNADLNHGNVEQLYIARNTSQDVAPLVDENKGEMILFHGGPAAWYGQVVSAAGTTVTVRTDGQIDGRALHLYNFNNGVTYSGPLTDPLTQVRSWGLGVDNQMYAYIAGGSGMGQIRKVVAHTSNSVAVDSPWRVAPAADSKLVLTYVYRNNIIYRNTLNAYPAGQPATYSASNMIQIDSSAWSNVTEGNTGQRTFVGRLLAGHDLGLSAWNEFRNDSMYNVQRGGIQVLMWQNLLDTQVYPTYTLDLIGPATLGNAIRGGHVQVSGPVYDTFPVQLEQSSFYLGSWSRNTVGSRMKYHVGNMQEGVQSSGGRRGLNAGDWADTLYRNNSVAVDAATPVPSSDIPTQGVYVRRFADPILGDNNTYSGAWSKYVKEANTTFSSKLTPLYREARFQTPATVKPAAVAIPLHNGGVDPANWTGTADQVWITLPQASGTVPAETAGILPVSADPTGLSAGVYWGTVTLQSGSQTLKIGVRLQVY